MRLTPIPSSTNQPRQQGYSLVELIVALTVLMIYIALFLQIYVLNEQERISIQRRNTADFIAYSNLKKIVSTAQIPTGAPFACNTATDTTANNLTVKSDATGVDLIANGIIVAETPPSSLINAHQYLFVTYPQGCANGLPAKITSRVTYGTGTLEVSHATFIY